MKALIVPVIVILLASTTGIALADNNSMTSTQTSVMNGHGSTTTTTQSGNDKPHVVTHTDTGPHFCDGFPFCHPHPHIVIIHEHTTPSSHVIIVHRSSGSTTNQNIPIVFVKGAGFVAPINCKLTSAGDKIVCDFEQVQIN